MTGLHLGFGLNVVADEYKSDVDVLGIAKYASGGEKWTFTGPKMYSTFVDEILADSHTGDSIDYVEDLFTYNNTYKISIINSISYCTLTINKIGEYSYIVKDNFKDDYEWTVDGKTYKINWKCKIANEDVDYCKIMLNNTNPNFSCDLYSRVCRLYCVV